MQFNALINGYDTQPSGTQAARVQLNLIGSSGQTPMVFPFDGVRLELRRTSPGLNAPALKQDEPVQVLNAQVATVHNEAPNDSSVVAITVDGLTGGLEVWPGDSLAVDLTRVSPGAGAPAIGVEPVAVTSAPLT